MTKKRNLLLVSLFLVFGLAAMAPSAMAQLVFVPGASVYFSGRAEGLAEGSGQFSLTNATAGTLGPDSFFDIAYTAPITDTGTVLLVCTSSTGTTGFTTGCPGVGTPILTITNPSIGYDTVHIPIMSPITFSGVSELVVMVRLNATYLAPGGGIVTAHVTATFVNGSTGRIQNPYPLAVLLIQNEPALSVQYGSEGQTIEGEVNLRTCKKVIAPDDHFVVNVGEAFPLALTSEEYEKELNPLNVTNGSIIRVTIDNIPHKLWVQATAPVPCSSSSTPPIPMACPGGNLVVVNAPGATMFDGPGSTATFEYVVEQIDNYSPENTNLPFYIGANGAVGGHNLPPMTVTVSIQPNGAPAIPRFVNFAENATPLPVVEFTNCP